MSWYNFLTKSELVERAQEVSSEKQAIQKELQERPKDEQEWSQLSEEEKRHFIETAPGWPGWIF